MCTALLRQYSIKKLFILEKTALNATVIRNLSKRSTLSVKESAVIGNQKITKAECMFTYVSIEAHIRRD